MPPAAFFSQHWEVAPLVCRGSGSRGALDAMPTWEDLLTVLDTAASTGSLIVLKDQHPTDEYVKSLVLALRTRAVGRHADTACPCR